MLDAATLAERREGAIAELDRFLSTECGAVRIPDAEARAIPIRGFVAGWQLAVQPVEQTRRLDVYVDAKFPFSIPRFLLVDRPPFLTWPHVEKDGVLCLSDEALTVDASRPAGIARDLLKSAYPFLRDSELGKNRDDFRTEFYSYWNWAVPAGAVPTYSLLDPHGPCRRVRIWRGEHFSVVGEDADSVLRWLRNLYGDQKQFDGTEPSCLLWLDRPPLPEEYPDCSSAVWQMANSVAGGREVLSEMALEDKRSLRVMLGAMSENGPCFGAMSVSRVAMTNVMGRGVDTINKGFRPNRVPQELLAQRVFNTSGPVSRSKVERVDTSWIHGRDNDPRQLALRKRRVAIVGCGAIGAPVAAQLAMAGVGNVLLIDPEVLAWSNVGRHPLGAESVGLFKALALAKKFTASFPHSRFDSRSEGFGDVVLKESNILLDCDLIVCATGIWSVESAVNVWHWSENGPRHVVYAWTEPHACAGHAVAVKRGSSCLQCQFSPFGDSKLIVTDWAETGTKREPACGAVYQPFGPVELSWTTALASGLALDCLLEKVPESTHRIWASPRPLLVSAGGTWNPEWIGGKAERETGGFQEERLWAKDATCSICN